MEFTPAWAVAWFFIPVANLFMPYRAMREIYRASEPTRFGRDWGDAEVPPMLPLWWGTWVALGVLANRELVLLLRDDAVTRALLVWFDVGVLGLIVAVTVLLIRVLRAIDARQEAKRARLAGAAAPVAPFAP